MIKALSLINFQSHRKSDLDFDPGVNVIVGSSDSGKTAILRALNWIVNNRPSGDCMRSHWGGTTKAVAVFDKAIVCRERSDTVNNYWLNEEQFKAFGLSVPDEIIQLINMTDLNVQRQLDAPFLLSNSSGEVAQILNESVNLQDIDVALSAIASKVREVTKGLNEGKESLKDVDSQLEGLEGVEELEVQISELDVLIGAEQKYSTKVFHIDDLVNSANRIERAVTSLEPVLNLEKDINSADEMMVEYHEAVDEHRRLNILLNTFQGAHDELEGVVSFLELEKDIQEIFGLLEELREANKELSKLRFQIDSLDSTAGFLEDVIRELEEKEAEYTDAMPDVCPLCGNKVKK